MVVNATIRNGKRKKRYLKISVVAINWDQENSRYEDIDEHVYDSKALPELIEKIIKSDSITAEQQ